MLTIVLAILAKTTERVSTLWQILNANALTDGRDALAPIALLTVRTVIILASTEQPVWSSNLINQMLDFLADALTDGGDPSAI